MKLIRSFGFAIAATLLIWGGIFWWGGWGALFTVIVLTALETTFSADNAVINSKVLMTMSHFWRILFLTVGIFIAVFVVRFILPILIVMLTAHLGFNEVLQLALNDSQTYAHYLETAEPSISAFGGAFLLLIALSYFIDYQKKTHWFDWLESHLGQLGRYDNVTTFIMLLGSLLLYFTVSPHDQHAVLLASSCAITLHIALDLMDAVFEKHYSPTSGRALKTGLAGFTAFAYLEVLDASFSLDGVIGAFALTGDVILIMAGLGAGAVWVRSLTVYLVKEKTLSKYIYLEHGAHWAIAFLGTIMWLKLYDVHPPEFLVGIGGLVVITLALIASRRPRAMKVQKQLD
ncbi:MAG TPA: DUF475 domain-containing protein [Candidatus Saccharimonadales bacterium]|nr:DUF475 domain-containing protein [Candidatus Saccharimonadales bacterium]